MKIVFTTLVLFLAMFCIAESQDTISVEIYNINTAIIWHKHISANCGSKFEVEVTSDGTHFTVTETDTSTEWAFCDCIFNLSTTITFVPAGDYTVDIYRREKPPNFPKDTIYLEGSVPFHIDMGPLPPSKIDFKQSECLGSPWNGVDETQNNNIPAIVYPNPASSSVSVKYESSSYSKIQISIYDILGNEIFSSSEDCNIGMNEKVIECRSLGTGYYIIRLKQGERVEAKPVMIIRN